MATNTSTQNASTGYTQTSTSNSASPGLSYSSSSTVSGGTSASRSATTTSTTNPAGSLVTMYQNFSVTQATGYTESGYAGSSTSNTVSGTEILGAYSNSYGYNYGSSSSEGGYASGSAGSVSVNASYSVAQSFSGFFGTSNMNYDGWFAPPNQSVSSTTSTSYTTFSAAYGESDSITGSLGMPKTNLVSASFTVSSTNIVTNSNSVSTVSTSLVPSLMGWSTMTMSSTLTSVGSTTTSMLASQTNSAGVINETITGGVLSSYYENLTTSGAGGFYETITSGGSLSTYTDTYTPTGLAAVTNSSASSTLTTITGTSSTATTNHYQSAYSYSISGAIAPTVPLLLQSIGIVDGGTGSAAGGGGSTSGSGALGSSSGLGSSSSGSLGSSGSSGSSGSAGSSSSSSSTTPSGSSGSNPQIAGALNAIAESSPAAATVLGQIYVPGGAVTLTGPAISSTAGASNAEQAGLVAIAQGQAGGTQLHDLPDKVVAPSSVLVNIYIDKKSLPADFDVEAIRTEMEGILSGVHAKVNIILTDRPRDEISNLGVIYQQTPMSEKGPIAPPVVKEVNIYVEFRTARRAGLWVASTIDYKFVFINSSFIQQHIWEVKPKNYNIFYANILVHEIFYHAIMGNEHIPGIPFERTPFGRSEANPHRRLRLTDGEKWRLNWSLNPFFPSQPPPLIPGGANSPAKACWQSRSGIKTVGY